MDKYDRYSYSKTLKTLDSWFDWDTEKTNYAQVLLGMNSSTTIEDCFKIYKKVHEKYTRFLKLDGQYADNDFYEDLNTCLNENLLRLLQQNTETASDFALECLANMRQCNDLKIHQQEWKAIILQRGLDIPSDTISSIIESQEKYEEARSEYMANNYPLTSNGFKRVSREISDRLNVLKAYGYKALPYDADFSYKSEFQTYLSLLGLFALFAVSLIILAILPASWQLIAILCAGIILGFLSVYYKK